MRIFATAFCAALCAAPVAAQQNNCAPYAQVEQFLAEGFGESRHAIGLTAAGGLLTIWANEETGTWTITVTGPDGVTCLAVDGSSFGVMSDPLPPQL